MRQTDKCPVCNKTNTTNLFTLKAVPVANNVLCNSYEEAISFPMGNLNFAVCCDCGYAWNTAFDPDLLTYDSAYENNQSYSQAFQDHIDTVISRFPVSDLMHPANIVEVGCGQGYFLKRIKTKLLEQVASLIGFDPAVRKENETSEIIAGVLDKHAFPVNFSPDIFVSRHVIEHIPDVNSFVKNICENTPSCRYGIIETPSLEWIVNTKAYFDMYYEHCSLFTMCSLGLILQKFGFEHCDLEYLFHGQYLLAIGNKSGERNSHQLDNAFKANVLTFANDFKKYTDEWAKRVALLKKKHSNIGVWGAASKGVNFLHHMHAQGITVDCCVDINLQKQGKFMPGCGTPILCPEEAWARGINSFIVANPNYSDEIAHMCSSAGVNAVLTPLQ